MDDNEISQKLNKFSAYSITILCAVISVALAVLAIGMAVKYEPSHPRSGQFFTIVLGIIVPFALFFAVVAFRGFSSLLFNREELMSINGWRLLAVLLLVCGILGFIYGHWIALLLPGAMALFCMMKEEPAAKKIQFLLLKWNRFINKAFGIEHKSNKRGQ